MNKCIISLLLIFIYNNAFAQTAETPNEKLNGQARKWNLSIDDLNSLAEWEILKKAGGCKRIKEFEIEAKKSDAIANKLAGDCYYNGLGGVYSTKISFQYYNAAKNLGLMRAYVNLGEQYENGIGIKINPIEAYKLYAYAAQNGALIALPYKWKMQLWGNGTKEDIPGAPEEIKKYAQKGNPIAQNYYGRLLATGKIIPKDPSLAREMLDKADEAGNSWARLTKANLYRINDIYDRDIKKSEELYLSAAESGNSKAMYEYATAIGFGYDEKYRIQEAISWLKKAAEAGNREAKTILAIEMIHGYNMPQDKEKGIKIFKDEIANGNKHAMKEFAWLYAEGYFIPLNVDKAIELNKMAIAQDDDSEAKLNIAQILLRHRPRKDSAIAIKYLKSAVEDDNVYAKETYGIILIEGDLVKKDETLGEKLLTESANQYNGSAMHYLGVWLRNKDSMSAKARGLIWLEKGANTGNFGAMFDYGLALYNGEDGGGNEERGLELIKAAANSYDEIAETAKKKLQRIATEKCNQDPDDKECKSI